MRAGSPHSSSNRVFQPFEESFQQVFHGKYKLRILWDLQDGPRRFGEIRKRLNNGTVGTKEVAPRVLSRVLKALAEFGLIRRKAYSVVPPRVEYYLTPLGRTLLPIISQLRNWGVEHLLRQPALGNYRFVPQTTEGYSAFSRGTVSRRGMGAAGKHGAHYSSIPSSARTSARSIHFRPRG